VREGLATRLPERIEGEGLVLRRWLVEDAELQERAVSESLEHLRPWMPFIAEEPKPLEQRRRMIAAWERDWAAGGDVYLAVVLEDRIAGSTGLHRRRGPHALEIGYWTHPAFLRRGIATRVARLLTDTALALEGIDRVEIRHDRANVASSRVPRRLGFALIGEAERPPAAPAETGVDFVWEMTRAAWERLRPAASPRPAA
jgi:ribosomal-protein-serine acetyltransferase